MIERNGKEHDRRVVSSHRFMPGANLEILVRGRWTNVALKEF